jgi:hypothetical protein
MGDFDKLFHEALTAALARGDVKEDEIDSASEEILQSLIPDTAAALIKGLKSRSPKMLRLQKRSDAGFERRNYRRWEKPLDLLELLWTVSEEVGGAFNQAERPAAAEAKDYQFDALVSLHARALLIGREILCLLYGGYPDGALSRWRSLHEIAATAVFLQTQDQELSHRYLASFQFTSYKAAKQLKEYAERARIDPASEEEMDFMKRQCEAFAERFGNEMYNDYGWASAALNNSKPNFSQIEKAVGLDHWRPRYRWASQHTHGGYRPPLALLGAAEVTQPMHLVGQSNSGFTDPLHMTAISLNQVTSSLLATRPKLDNIIFIQVISGLSNEIGDAALEVDSGGETKAAHWHTRARLAVIDFLKSIRR